MITKDPERQDTLESEFEGENEGKDVDTSDTDNLGESLNDSRRSDAAGQKTRENSSMNGILGGLKHKYWGGREDSGLSVNICRKHPRNAEDGSREHAGGGATGRTSKEYKLTSSQVTVDDVLCTSGELRNKLEEEKELRISLEKQLESLRERGGRFYFTLDSQERLRLCKNFIILFSAIFLGRYKKEKEMRHKLQVELEFETKKKAQLEETVKSLQFQFRTSKSPS